CTSPPKKGLSPSEKCRGNENNSGWLSQVAKGRPIPRRNKAGDQHGVCKERPPRIPERLPPRKAHQRMRSSTVVRKPVFQRAPRSKAFSGQHKLSPATRLFDGFPMEH